MIPFLSFDYQDELYRDQLLDSMTRVLDSKWYILGNELFEFEMRMIEIREQINKVKEDSKYSDDELGELDLES